MLNCQIPNQDYKVLVRCNTFNQSKYIEDALNGFVMQKTNFPFVCLVMDDCSTDGEQEVIKTWMERECDMDKAEFVDLELSNVILVPHKTNFNCTFAFYLLKRNTWKERDLKVAMYAPWREHCKYEALCEGDDYWIDPLKLQKQVDILEENENIGLVYAMADIFDQNISKVVGQWGTEASFSKIATQASCIPTLSVCMRVNLLKQFENIKLSSPKFKLGDVPMWLYFLHTSKVHFLDEVVGVYRLLGESASHSSNIIKRMDFIYSAFSCRQYYSKLFGYDDLSQEVLKIKTENLLFVSFEQNVPLQYPVFYELIKCQIYNIRLLMLCILSNCKMGRYLVNTVRKLR